MTTILIIRNEFKAENRYSRLKDCWLRRVWRQIYKIESNFTKRDNFTKKWQKKQIYKHTKTLQKETNAKKNLRTIYKHETNLQKRKIYNRDNFKKSYIWQIWLLAQFNQLHSIISIVVIQIFIFKLSKKKTKSNQIESNINWRKLFIFIHSYLYWGL